MYHKKMTNVQLMLNKMQTLNHYENHPYSNKMIIMLHYLQLAYHIHAHYFPRRRDNICDVRVQLI